jgi:cytochrome b subunit of formate dehydrogenase
MDPGELYFFIIVSGVLILLGIIAILWGIREEKKLFEALASKPDLREFSLKHVESPQPGALKIGGWIAIAVGVIILVAGLAMWRWGWPPW